MYMSLKKKLIIQLHVNGLIEHDITCTFTPLILPQVIVSTSHTLTFTLIRRLVYTVLLLIQSALIRTSTKYMLSLNLPLKLINVCGKVC